MRTIIVGGELVSGRESGIINKLANKISEFSSNVSLYNGLLPETLNLQDLIIWAPSISNEEKKIYPKKDKGSVMIISKFMHDKRTEVDAVSRIFVFGANAVICIYKNISMFRFKLIDALGNTWVDTSNIDILAKNIEKFYIWSKGQIRMSFVNNTPLPEYANIQLPSQFVEMNTVIADKVESSLGTRYFGNFSTRCMKLFPSIRLDSDTYLFSPRNTDKHRLNEQDFVLVKPPYYYGDRMYSVDSPVQIMLYRQFPDINYMIHGHAFITDPIVPITNRYYPCGDLREVETIANLFLADHRMCNLKNHGFLLTAHTLQDMQKLIELISIDPHDMLK
jgi:hypothetical protein